MRAGTVQRFDTLEIGEIEVADPAPGQVRVRVHHCGICHSDYTVLAGGLGQSPQILGHEASGIVDAVGDGVELLAVGDHVVLTPIASCGRCYWCTRAQPSQCVNKGQTFSAAFLDGTTGLSRNGEVVYRGMGVGGFAEYALVSETGAIKIPADMPLDVACVIGCAVQTGAGAVLNTAQGRAGCDRARARARRHRALGRCRARTSPARRGSSAATRSPTGGRWRSTSARPT